VCLLLDGNDTVPISVWRGEGMRYAARLLKAGMTGNIFCCCFFFIFLNLFFNDPCQTNYHNICRAHLHQIFRVGRSLWLWMINLKLVFRSSKERCHGNHFFGFIHRTDFHHASSS